MSDSTTDSTTLQMMRNSVLRRLKKVEKRVQLQLVLQGLNACLWIAIVFCVGSFVVDWKLELSVGTRVLIFSLVFVLFAYQAVRRICFPLNSNWLPIEIASLLDGARASSAAEVLPKVATLFQPIEAYDKQSSQALIQEAARQSFWSLERIPFENRLNRKHLRFYCLGIGSGFTLLALFFAMLPAESSAIWIGRWLAGKDSAWPRNTQILLRNAEDGTLYVARGEPFEVKVETRQKVGDPPTQVRIDLRYDQVNRERLTVPRKSSQGFCQQVGAIHHSGTMYLRAGDAKLGPIHIQPIDRPRIVGIELQNNHPLSKSTQFGDLLRGDRAIQLLPMTNAKLRFQANVPLEAIRTEFPQEQFAKNENRILIEREADDSFSVKWQHESELMMNVQVVGRIGGIASSFRAIHIGLAEDRPPVLRLVSQGVGQRVSPNATIPLFLEARDDLGMNQVQIETASRNLRANNQSSNSDFDSTNLAFNRLEPSPVILKETSRIAFEVDFRLPLREQGLPVGSLFQVKATATDNCLTGQQTSDSNLLAFQIVSPEEIFQEILLRQQQLRMQLQEQYERASDQKLAIQRVDLRQGLPKVLRFHRNNSLGVQAVHLGLAETKEEMELNQIGGEETIRLIDDNLLAPLMNVWKGDMTRQRTLLSQYDAEKNAKGEILDQQQRIIDGLSLVLKNMSHWDSFAEVVNQLDAVIKMQENVRNKTEKLKENEIESIFD